MHLFFFKEKELIIFLTKIIFYFLLHFSVFLVRLFIFSNFSGFGWVPCIIGVILDLLFFSVCFCIFIVYFLDYIFLDHHFSDQDQLWNRYLILFMLLGGQYYLLVYIYDCCQVTPFLGGHSQFFLFFGTRLVVILKSNAGTLLSSAQCMCFDP